ncbi:MAG: hypothetical protein R2815_09915 [Flavobacteriales bacterium]
MALVVTGLEVRAQNIAINATGAAPVASAMLDITSADKGVLVPRVALLSATDVATVPAPANSLLIYNTATAGASPNNVTPGYHYWDGPPTNRWQRLAAVRDAWLVTGNVGTNTTNNFIGTTDPVGLRIRTDNAPRFEIMATGELRSFGDGTALAPAYSWTTNTNMGTYRIAASTLGFATNGVERMRIQPLGNVGIGGTPATGALLDVSAPNRGILVPRVALTSTNSNMPVGAAGIITSLLVYNTATAGTGGTAVNPGYYYWDGTRWRRFVDLISDIWYYPPLNINALTRYTLTATIPGVTTFTGAAVTLVGDWGVAPQVVIESVESRTGAIRFVVNNNSFTNYLGMDFLITTFRY